MNLQASVQQFSIGGGPPVRAMNDVTPAPPAPPNYFVIGDYRTPGSPPVRIPDSTVVEGTTPVANITAGEIDVRLPLTFNIPVPCAPPGPGPVLLGLPPTPGQPVRHRPAEPGPAQQGDGGRRRDEVPGHRRRQRHPHPGHHGDLSDAQRPPPGLRTRSTPPSGSSRTEAATWSGPTPRRRPRPCPRPAPRMASPPSARPARPTPTAIPSRRRPPHRGDQQRPGAVQVRPTPRPGDRAAKAPTSPTHQDSSSRSTTGTTPTTRPGATWRSTTATSPASPSCSWCPAARRGCSPSSSSRSRIPATSSPTGGRPGHGHGQPRLRHRRANSTPAARIVAPATAAANPSLVGPEGLQRGRPMPRPTRPTRTCRITSTTRRPPWPRRRPPAPARPT